MVTRVQKYGGTSHSALDYNENKVNEGVASVVAYNEMPDDTWFSIHEAFRAREELPSVDPRIRNVLLHLTVNPGADDSLSREDALRYIGELMTDLGYGGQPYVVYRHNDIEREHYHIVASNIMPDGHAVSPEFIGLRIKQIQIRLAEKYGFFLGNPDAGATKKTYKPGFIHKGDTDVLARMRTNIEEVFRYRCRDGLELRAALLAFGMELRGADKDGVTYYSFRCKDEDGALTKRPVSIRRAAGMDSEGFIRRMQASFAEARGGERSVKDTAAAVLRCYVETRDGDGTREGFRRRLAQRGITMFGISAARQLPARRGQEADFLFVDTRRGCVVTLAETQLQLSAILALREDAAAARKRRKLEQRHGVKKGAGGRQ